MPTRRAALLIGAAAAAQTAAVAMPTDVATLTRLAADANAAFIRGDMKRWAEKIVTTPDFTLMSPFGGWSRGFDPSEARLAELARMFAGGEGTFELIEAYASGDLVVLAAVERQRGVVGDLPEQDWSLRVTLVFRRVGEVWRLAHRHADQLAEPLGLQAAARIARGEIGAPWSG
jgi:ketosteroid isomerase-like protein